MKKLFFILALFNTLAATAAQITASIDRNPVSLSESFTLTYTADESPDDNPNFAPLEQSFEILKQKSQASWVNGKSSTTIKWTLQLMAKQAGDLIIPSITFGNDKTEAIPLKVNAGSTHTDINTNEDLLLKVEASPLNPYVQSQVLYTMRLFRKVNITQARLDEPKLTDAIIKKIGDDSTYNTQINGVDYLVTERKYSIFPQKSGTVTIDPLNLMAEVLDDNNARFNGFFNQQSTRTQKIASNAVILNVRPAPTNAKMPHWLPAEELLLQQEWSGDFTQMKVGEPLTRTLTVVAKGTTDGLLPELNTPSPDAGLKTYPDQPVIKEMQKPEGVYAMREEKVAYIPASAGTFTLPAIEVPWFNTQTQQVQVAKIPAVTLTVLAANGTTTPTINLLPTPTLVAPATVNNSTPLATPSLPQTNQWMWVSLFLGLGWISTLIYFLTKRQPAQTKTEAETIPSTQLNITPKLKRACQNNDKQLAKEVLLEWGLAEFNTTSLGELANFCDARLRDEVLNLNQSLYAPLESPQDWQGKKLLQTFSEHLAAHKIKTNNGSKPDKLEPLYRL